MAPRSRKGDAPPVGYPEWDRSRDGRDRQAPETGRRDPRRQRWVPQERAPESDDFVEPFPARWDRNSRPVQDRAQDEWGTGSQRRYEAQPGRRRSGEDSYPAWRPAGRSVPPSAPHSALPDNDNDEDDEDEDEDEPDQRDIYIGSFSATAGWYLVPVAAYTAWSLTQSGTPRAGCTNQFGLACPAPRAEALSNLANAVPQIAVAMALSITVAMFLGWVTTGWRPFAIGFASAVLGAGVATVVFAVLDTQV
jgi:hypothetical protein